MTVKRTVKAARANRARAVEFALSREGREIRERMLALPKHSLVAAIGRHQAEFFLAPSKEAANRAVSKLTDREIGTLLEKLVKRGHVHKVIEEIQASL